MVDRRFASKTLCYNLYELVYDHINACYDRTLYGTYDTYEQAEEDGWEDLYAKTYIITAERIVNSHRPYMGRKKQGRPHK